MQSNKRLLRFVQKTCGMFSEHAIEGPAVSRIHLNSSMVSYKIRNLLPLGANCKSLILILLLAGCSGEPNYSLHELPSGKKIKIQGMGIIHFTKDDPGLMLKYLTDIPIDNMDALRAEANEIWPIFKVDVEKANLTIGILSAQGPAEKVFGSIITTNRSYKFVWKQRQDGSWESVSKEAKQERQRQNQQLH